MTTNEARPVRLARTDVVRGRRRQVAVCDVVARGVVVARAVVARASGQLSCVSSPNPSPSRSGS